MEQLDIVFKELANRFQQPMKRVISKYFQNEMDQDDMYQDIVIHIYEQLKKMEDIDFIKWTSEAWIKVVVKNKCITILRSLKSAGKHSKTMQDDRHFEVEISQSNYVDEAFVPSSRSMKSIRIEELLIQLNERDRKLIILRFYKNKSIKEVDQILGITNSAVYTIRAVEKLKTITGASQFYEFFDGFVIED